MAELICGDVGVRSIFRGGWAYGYGSLGWIPWRIDWMGLYSTLYISVMTSGMRAERVISIGGGLQDTVRAQWQAIPSRHGELQIIS